VVSSVVTGPDLGTLHSSALFGPELSALYSSALTGPDLGTPETGLNRDQVLKTATEGHTMRFDAGLKMPEQISLGSGSCQAWLPALQRNTQAIPVLFVQGEALWLHHFLGILEVNKVIVSL